ncbi:MAG: hypothetical protein A2Y38_15555 [Spirochaetes bacterium GWB1_59_5]|nr:MAG: hypothetical protein A2Y38_15555 [Spirochaetes bacterium GWB1_59_5]
MIRGDVTQGDFAKKIEVHKNTIGRWEKGEQTPTQEQLCRILGVYPEINPAWLLTGEGPMKGFTAKHMTEADKEKLTRPAEELIVNQDTLELIGEIFREKAGERRWEIDADKTMLILSTLYQFYSRNFIESAKFRRDTMEKNIENIVLLALPDKK